MEDDNGLELSLGLSFGGLSSKSKGKNASSSDIRAEDRDRGNKAADEFKNFLNAATQRQDSSNGFQRGDSAKPKENFFNDLSKASFDGEASLDLNGEGVFEEEKRAETGTKRRMFFEDMIQQKKQEREANFADVSEKTRASHISLATDEGSTAENEDVAESEVEGSTSRLVHHLHEDGSKRFIGIGGSSDIQKEIRGGISDSKAADPGGHKRFGNSSENGFKLGNMPYGGPFPGQPVNMMNMPFPLPPKDGNSGVATSSPAHLLPGMMQVMPALNTEGPTTQPVYPGNLPLMFGYPPVQIPLLDKDNSWGLVPQPQQFHPSFPGRGPPNSALMQVIPHNQPEAAQQDGRASKADGKQHASEEGSSSHAEDGGKGSSTNVRVKDAAPDHRSVADGSSHEFSSIKPGILADVKFGGSGSCPNLPWVSTTGQNGRTISGVTYRYNANQIRIVCACHGTHMSPEEFVRHANEDPGNNPENGGNNGLSPFLNTNPAASADS